MLSSVTGVKPKFFFCFGIIVLSNFGAFAQKEKAKVQENNTVKLGFCNVLRRNSHAVLVGGSNVSLPDHQGLELGFSNIIFGDFQGVQLGMVNTGLQELSGLQLGNVNMTKGMASGLQWGNINITVGGIVGAQLGNINISMKETRGLQFGVINIADNSLEGVQMGFINYVDTVKSGAPIGFLSFVKKGGYYALDYSVNELYAYNLTFKLGVPKFYSYIQTAFHEKYDQQFALGFGFGSVLPLRSCLYFNPEVGMLFPIFDKNQENEPNPYVSIFRMVPSLGCNLGAHFHVAAGPTFSWIYLKNTQDMFLKPFYSFQNHLQNDHNRYLVGAQLSVGYVF